MTWKEGQAAPIANCSDFFNKFECSDVAIVAADSQPPIFVQSFMLQRSEHFKTSTAAIQSEHSFAPCTPLTLSGHAQSSSRISRSLRAGRIFRFRASQVPTTASLEMWKSLLRSVRRKYRDKISSPSKTPQPRESTTPRISRPKPNRHLLRTLPDQNSRSALESFACSRCPTAGLCFSQTPLVSYCLLTRRLTQLCDAVSVPCLPLLVQSRLPPIPSFLSRGGKRTRQLDRVRLLQMDRQQSGKRRIPCPTTCHVPPC